MSDDIVTRLCMFSLDDGADELNNLLTDAAGEIERLRSLNTALAACLEGMKKEVNSE